MATSKTKASLSAKKKVDGVEGRRTSLYMDLILKFLNKIRCCVAVGMLLESSEAGVSLCDNSVLNIVTKTNKELQFLS